MLTPLRLSPGVISLDLRDLTVCNPHVCDPICYRRPESFPLPLQAVRTFQGSPTNNIMRCPPTWGNWRACNPLLLHVWRHSWPRASPVHRRPSSAVLLSTRHRNFSRATGGGSGGRKDWMGGESRSACTDLSSTCGHQNPPAPRPKSASRGHENGAVGIMLPGSKHRVVRGLGQAGGGVPCKTGVRWHVFRVTCNVDRGRLCLSKSWVLCDHSFSISLALARGGDGVVGSLFAQEGGVT